MHASPSTIPPNTERRRSSCWAGSCGSHLLHCFEVRAGTQSVDMECMLQVNPGLRPEFAAIQGLFFAAPAVDVVEYINDTRDRDAYLDEVATTLLRYDQWLWQTRNTSAICQQHSIGCTECSQRHPCPPHRSSCCTGGVPPDRGLLWSVGVADSGEDSSTRFCIVANHSVPCVP